LVVVVGPFTCHWLAFAGAPLKEISTPASNPLFFIVEASSHSNTRHQGCQLDEVATVQRSWLTCSLSMTPPTSPFSVFK